MNELSFDLEVAVVTIAGQGTDLLFGATTLLALMPDLQLQELALAVVLAAHRVVFVPLAL